MTHDDIIRRVARVFGVLDSAILGTGRTQRVALARHVAMWCCKREMHVSFTELARAFGNRDHKTIMSACSRVEDILAGNCGDAMRAEVQRAIDSAVALAKCDADRRDFPADVARSA